MDINCDIGEAFGQWRFSEVDDKEILPFISSANIAAGFHAGDPNQMNQLVELSLKENVKIGVHPGYRDLQGFGRRKITATTEELINDIVYQIGALREFCNLYGTTLNHVKPHGALYMEMAINKELSKRFVEVMQKIGNNIPIYCMGISETYSAAKKAGYPVVREFYADRDYDNNGSIVFTRHVDKVDIEKIKDKVLLACLENKVVTITGNTILIEFESVCFHSDTPGSLQIASGLKEAFHKNNIKLTAVNI